MGTAIVVAIVSGLVSLVSVLTNAYITRASIKAESTRAREAREAEGKRAVDAREAEDRRLREDRDAEAQRRAGEREVDRQAADGRRVAEQTEARWAAVRTTIETEAKLRVDPGAWSSSYKLKLQGISLLNHAEEANLRAALLRRAGRGSAVECRAAAGEARVVAPLGVHMGSDPADADDLRHRGRGQGLLGRQLNPAEAGRNALPACDPALRVDAGHLRAVRGVEAVLSHGRSRSASNEG